jgi:uncharacterized protein (DUF4415 family)
LPGWAAAAPDGTIKSNDDNVPELADEDFARAKPFAEVFPEQYRAWRKRSRSSVAQPKVHVGFRFAADVVQGTSGASGTKFPELRTGKTIQS